MDLKDIEPFLVDRLLQFARPIADACAAPTGHMRLQDAGKFFLVVDAFTLFHRQRLEETLLVVLDEFAHLDPRAYDELYLWSIVWLSRLDWRHVETFWPLVFALDLRYRGAEWKRPRGVALVDQPYRFTELLFYFYVLNTLQRRARSGMRVFPSLAACLRFLASALSGEQKALVVRTLRDLAQSEERPAYGDAVGLLLRTAD